MLTLGIVLLATMVAAELYVIKEWPWIGRLLRKNSKLSLLFSVALSFVLTMLFPAAGMLVLLASIGSTVVMQPIYRMMDRWAVWRGQLLAIRSKVQHVYNRACRVWLWMWHPVKAFRTRNS